MGIEDQSTPDISRWQRWTGDAGPFYRACAVFPIDEWSDTTVARRDNIEQPDIQFCTGTVRLLLRNLPVVVLLTVLIYFPTNPLFLAETAGPLQSLLTLNASTWLLLLFGSFVITTWALLVWRVSIPPFGNSSFHRTAVFVGTAIPLLAGTVFSVYFALQNIGSDSAPAFTVQSGFFLFILIEGHLIYDGLALRAEHLLERLQTAETVHPAEYTEFHRDLTTSLGSTITFKQVTVSRAVAFAIVLAFLPTVFTVFTTRWTVPAAISYTVYLLVTLLAFAVMYKFTVLIYKFTELINSDVIIYQPFHPDEHGGFYDFGRFATRVNLILVVAGMYVAYRFFAEGLLVLPQNGFNSGLNAITWGLLYLGPITVYMFLVVFWLYHSFWRLHKVMEHGRKQWIETLQHQNSGNGPSETSTSSDLDSNALAWESLQSAPVWPVRRQNLLGILIVDTMPIVIPFPLLG